MTRLVLVVAILVMNAATVAVVPLLIVLHCVGVWTVQCLSANLSQQLAQAIESTAHSIALAEPSCAGATSSTPAAYSMCRL